MRGPRLRAVLAGIGVIVLVAAACGSDDSDGAAEREAAEVQDVEVDEAALQAVLDEWRTDVDAYGATLSIRVPGRGDLHLASGIDDRDPDTPMPTDGTYHIFSITKSVTAAIALQLVNEGRLSLDDSVEPWLPELPNAEKITVAMLLDHTAGLSTWSTTHATEAEVKDFEETVVADLTRSFTPEEMLAKYVEFSPVAEPGEGFLYSNAHYGVLGVLIERELDQDFATVIEERITEPLSLTDTFFTDGSTKPTRHGWFSADGTDPERPIDWLDLPHEAIMTSAWAAGAIISSSEDMLDFGEALYSGELLGDDTTARMLEMQPGTSREYIEYYGLGAVGFCLDPTGCASEEMDVVGHGGGSMTGSRTLVGYHPESGLTLAVHANVFLEDPGLRSLPLLADVLHELGLVDEAAAEQADDADAAAP